jgi:hypothetical protein
MAEKRGYDAGKKIVGRKRHIAVDTDGRLLAVNLTTADISDSAGAQPILDAIRKRRPWMKRLFADGAYDRRTLLDKAAFLDFVVEGHSRRWAVERSIGWLTRRRLVRGLRATPRRLRSHDLPRYGKSAPPPDQSSMTFSNGLSGPRHEAASL